MPNAQQGVTGAKKFYMKVEQMWSLTAIIRFVRVSTINTNIFHYAEKKKTIKMNENDFRKKNRPSRKILFWKYNLRKNNSKMMFRPNVIRSYNSKLV